jgi:1,4-dihydroxy-2-naphthoyl-CoA hydrolase
LTDLAEHFVVPFDEAFDARYGLEYVTPTHGRLTIRRDLLGEDGTVQSGIYMAMAESIASTGTAVEVVPQGLIPSGLSNSTYVVGEARDGVIEAHARCRARATGEWLWDVRIGPLDGAATAIAVVVIAVRPKRV